MDRLNRVLIVDDEVDYCQMYSEPLITAGYTVECLYDGMNALRSIERDMPEILIIDHNMPYLTGIEVLQGLAEKRILVPVVIMLTGTHMRTSDHMQSAQPHVDLLLAKPFSPFQLQQIVDKFSVR